MKPLEKPMVFEFFCDSAKKLHKALAGSRPRLLEADAPAGNPIREQELP
jgi:hypothetical protein